MKYLAKMFIAAIKAPDGAMPEWYTYFPEGWVEMEGEGKALIDRKAYGAVAAYFARRGNDVVVDYEHQTMSGGKAPAAGWITEFRYVDGTGIQGKTTWNQDASEHIRKNEYRYFSPVFMVRKSDSRAIAIHSIALTNAPKTNHITPLLAKLGAEFNEEDVPMEFLKKMAAKLGLSEGSEEAVVEQAVVAIMAKNTALETAAAKGPEQVEVVAKDILSALELKDGDTASTVVASIHSLKQGTKGSVSRAEFEAIQNDLAQRDAKEVVAKAMTAGKVTPDQKAWATEYATRDLEGFKVFTAKAPVVIPVDNLPEKKEPGELVVDDSVLAIAKLMGNTAEDIKQFGA